MRNCGEHRKLNPRKTKKTCSHCIIYLKFYILLFFKKSERTQARPALPPGVPDEAMAASRSPSTPGARLSGTLETRTRNVHEAPRGRPCAPGTKAISRSRGGVSWFSQDSGAMRVLAPNGVLSTH